ncbi:DUF4386 domain-containing protein [Nocardia sp. NPDC051030]|uniref:DUF4386 domain-containing protein n=1 Tax=Nocardia sp. NPDC051030 TaxID=3155162 RepID=UPI003434A4B6
MATMPNLKSHALLRVPALLFAVLTIAYVIANKSAPRPGDSGREVLANTLEHDTTIKVGAFLLFDSAVVLAILAAVAYHWLRENASTAPRGAVVLTGGTLAAGALLLSAVFCWAGGRLTPAASPDLARALADAAFLTGGPAYAVMFAVFVAGLVVSARDLLPAALNWTGGIITVLGAISTLTLVADGFAYLLPVVRFGGLLWLLVTVFAVRVDSSARIGN